MTTGDAHSRLVALVDELASDGELSDEDLARIADAAAAETARVRGERAWRETAHVHRTAHVDSEKKHDAVCHDCGRALISDVGTERILVCPKLHGRRPAEMVPTTKNGAVECGQPES